MQMIIFLIMMTLGLSLIGWLIVYWRSGQARAARAARVSQRLRRLRHDQRKVDWTQEDNEEVTALPSWTPNFIRVRIARADLAISSGAILMGAVFVGALLLTIALFVSLTFSIVSLALIVGLLFGVLELIAARRLNEFREGLPNYFERVRQLLLVGNTLHQSLGRAIASTNENSRRYLEPMARRIEHGATVADSVGWLAERIDLPELHMFHTAIDTNMRYGGRIADILGNLIRMLKDQDRVRRELQATTSETRGSASVLTGLPLVISLGFALINPQYISFFITEPSGHNMLMISASLIISGAMVLRRMMKQGGAL